MFQVILIAWNENIFDINNIQSGNHMKIKKASVKSFNNSKFIEITSQSIVKID